MWKELISVLQEILSVYEEIFMLSEKKRVALRNVAVKDMESVVRREQALAKEIGKLEKERIAVSNQIVAAEKLPTGKLSAVIAAADVAVAEELTRIHEKLKDVLGKIAANNKESEAWTRQSLELMQYKINILTEIKVEPTYAGDGREGISASKWFDFKA